MDWKTHDHGRIPATHKDIFLFSKTPRPARRSKLPTEKVRAPASAGIKMVGG
jgi:hypothetical protein